MIHRLPIIHIIAYMTVVLYSWRLLPVCLVDLGEDTRHSQKQWRLVIATGLLVFLLFSLVVLKIQHRDSLRHGSPDMMNFCLETFWSLGKLGEIGTVDQKVPVDCQGSFCEYVSELALIPQVHTADEVGLDFAAVFSRVSIWDEGDRQFRVNGIAPGTPPNFQSDVLSPGLSSTLRKTTGPATTPTVRWQLTTESPAKHILNLAVEQVDSGVLSIRLEPSPAQVSAVGVCLPANRDEHFFGLGQRFGRFDLAGQVVENWTADQALEPGRGTSYAPTPFLLSSRGYGLLLDTTARATFDLRTEPHGCVNIQVAANQLHLYLISGPHPQTVLERHARLVGLPPLPPPWAFGVWKNLIGGQTQIKQDVQRLRQEDIPIDAVWIYDAVDERTGFGWPWQIYGPIPTGAYPNLPRLIQDLHHMDLKVLGYLHPFFYPNSDSYSTAREQDFLVLAPDGQPYVEEWTFSPRSYLDFTNPQASTWWQERVRLALTESGFDGAMLDFGENAPVRAFYANNLPGELMHNYYPVLYHQAAHDAGQAAKPGDFVFFARAGYSRSQSYSTGRFTGDQVRSWDPQRGLPSVIPAILNGSLSGWPYWGPDIAGFFGYPRPSNKASPEEEAAQLKAEKELWIRWVQLGALSPTMRDMYGWQRNPVGLWTDEETLTVFRAYARLHTALKPYLYRYAQLAHERGIPIVRPLFLNYPAESVTYTLADQYLLGDDLLAAPVLQPGRSRCHIYLPAERWRNYWTGQVHQGPGWVTVPVPLHQIPFFIREGSTLNLPTPQELRD